MKTVLFCGGLGTRIRDYAENIPKPMIPIGGKPILWHLMSYYSQYGHLVETDAVRFPQPYTCVSAGDVIGVVGEARPAPHLHVGESLSDRG
jgi:molybdopterin-guanine dinucleotide biosynthesis protein A